MHKLSKANKKYYKAVKTVGHDFITLRSGLIIYNSIIQASFEDNGSETSEMAIQSTLNILFSFMKNIFNGINRLAPETLFYLDDVLPMNTHIFTFVPIHICIVCMKK